MPVRPPSLDDRNFDDLVEELIARIPAHTPEWTNPRQGDPGRTLIELFAWLTDTLLYRVNLIPERQRLAFLRLLGVGMRPAIPARGFVSLFFDDEKEKGALYLRPQAIVKGPVPFETRSEVTVLPVAAEAYAKRKLAPYEESKYASLVLDLKRVYRVTGTPKPYVTTPVFPGGMPETNGFDQVRDTVDGCLWFALLAAKPELVEDVRATLGSGSDGRQQLLNVGVVPTIRVHDLFEEIGPRARIPHVWEVSGNGTETAPEYFQLEPVSDGTSGLTQQGVLRLALPAASTLGAPSNDPTKLLEAGVGDFPPRLDDTDKAARLVTWLRLRPSTVLSSLS
jgi:predicted phage baseplate assembly protein